MPNCLLEYMAAARPLVATAVGAVENLVKDGVHGMVVPPGDSTRLANAIAHLLQNPRQAAAMGQAARDHVRRHYSREVMVRQFERFYQNSARRHADRD
jgi:glycosyltransferase involved in cell wall biosynthesis